MNVGVPENIPTPVGDLTASDAQPKTEQDVLVRKFQLLKVGLHDDHQRARGRRDEDESKKVWGRTAPVDLGEFLRGDHTVAPSSLIFFDNSRGRSRGHRRRTVDRARLSGRTNGGEVNNFLTKKAELCSAWSPVLRLEADREIPLQHCR